MESGRMRRRIEAGITEILAGLRKDSLETHPAQQASLLMVAGAAFSGKEAADRGFVTKSVPKGSVHEEALKIARQIAANVDGVTRPLTQALRVRRSELQPVLESDATRQADSYSTKEFREQIARYLPGWYDDHEAR